MTFLAPALLFGLLLAAAPIIIHLLNRRRFLRVDWGPMKYLKLTLKANRRRLRLEQWILLAARTLAVVVLFLAVARPVGSSANLAEFLKTQGRASRVIVLDDSLSMAYRTGRQSLFDRGRQAVINVLRAVGAQDSLTVLTTARPQQPLVRHAQLTEAELERLVAELSRLTPSDTASHWTSTLDAVDQHLQESVFPIREVMLITDLWGHGWTPETADLCDRWHEDDVTLRIVDVGELAPANRKIVRLAQSDPVALVDTEVRLTATLRNDGSEPLAAGQATLNVDEHVQALTLPDVPAGETREVPVLVTFDTPGLHRVSLSLPHDDLPADDQAYLVVDVRPMVEVALVDGEPGLGPFESETDFLAVALTAGNAPWRMSPVFSSEWIAQPIGAPDVVVLANVETLPEARVRELEELVRAGMGLMIFAGEQVDPDEYNRLFERGGQGLLPGQMLSVREGETPGLAIEPHADSPMALLSRLSADSLSRIRPRRILGVSLPEEAAAGVRVLARWNDPQRSPAVLEKQFGEGSVLMWTMTADREWSDWPTEASFVLAMRLAAQSVAARVLRWENLTCGQPIRFPLDPDFAPQTAVLELPGVEEAVPLPIERPADGEPLLLSPPVLRAGHYRARWEEPGPAARVHEFAASPAIEDSRLVRLDAESLQPFLGRLVPRMIRFAGEVVDVATAGAELWRYGVIGLLALLVFESLFAPWVGRVR
jgi:hypothetical protein